MQDIFVGRQPIYNRDLGVYAYELLFRSDQINNAVSNLNEDQATSQVILNSFIDMGLENIVGQSKVCINLTDSFLMNTDALPINPENIILDIQQNITINTDTLTAINQLKAAGFTLALDDISHRPDFLPLLKQADILRLDVKKLSPKDIKLRQKILGSYNVRLLAEKVESLDDYEIYMDMGFDYFQGYFLSRPRILKSTSLETNKLSVINLLSTLHNAGADTSEVEKIINTDLSISYKLLKLINSAFFNLPSKVESIRHAIVILGRRKLTSWASMLVMSSMDDRPVEMVQLSMIRAKTCELLATAMEYESTDSFFTVGMFSALDMLMQRPIQQLLEPLPLADDIKQAILNHNNDMGRALNCALALETANEDNRHFHQLNPEQLSSLHLEAIAWANEVTRTLKSN